MADFDADLEYRAAFLKLLADKSRLRILALLSEKERTVKELAELLKLKEPTVSHHLSALWRAEVVAMRPEGTTHYYRLREEDIYAQLKALKTARRGAAEAFGEDEFERRVMQTFFENGQLTRIPIQQKKLLVVLRRLAQEFAPGERYTEKQVSETLKRFHPDHASLRRYLVDWKLLARENSIYWRTA